jgi:lipoprotein Spr
MKSFLTLITLLFLTASVATAARHKKSPTTHKEKSSGKTHHHKGKLIARNHHSHHTIEDRSPVVAIDANANTDDVSPDSLLSFAQNLIGTPYREASSNPLYGFDCSGFVSYVFRNFNFNVPRSSSEFANLGERINLEDAKPGDILLFTGTKTHHPHSIGHIAIVFSNDGDEIKFIHSTSGKEYCVTISTMDDTYKRRFVQVVRLLKQNDDVLASR